jgi:hypothetical protein
MKPLPLVDVLVPAVDERTGRRADLPVQISQQCATCKRLRDGLSCESFPAGIPEPILSGKHDHTEPFPGDHGLRYQPDPRL